MGRTFDDIIKEVNSNFDHELEYASDRNKHVKELLSENEEWITELISREDVMGKQVKSKKDPLAEDSNSDKILEQIADYILFPKFDDEDEHNVFNHLKKEEKELNKNLSQLRKLKKRKKSDKFLEQITEIEKNIMKLRQKVRDFNKNYLSESMKKKNKVREVLDGIMDKYESNNENGKYIPSGKLEIDEGYWDRRGFSNAGKEFIQDILSTYEESIDILKEKLGLNIKDKEARKRYTKSLIDYFDDNKLVLHLVNNKMKVLDGQGQYFKLRKMYGELVSDYNLAKEILASPIRFQSMTPTSTEYNFNEDTWYYNNNDEIIEVSRNLIKFSDPNTYKGLMTTYYDLNDKYEDDFMDDMWYILRTFEEIVNSTALTSEEKYVVSMLMNDKSRQEIMDGFMSKFHRDMSKQVLSSWINRTIPNKFVNTYLNSVDNWLYTYMIKGRYKQCTSCGEIKLINNDRHFRRRSNNAGDGYYNQCRKCESAEKR